MTLEKLASNMDVYCPVGFVRSHAFCCGALPDLFYEGNDRLLDIIEELDPELLKYEVEGISSGTCPNIDDPYIEISLYDWNGICDGM